MTRETAKLLTFQPRAAEPAKAKPTVPVVRLSEREALLLSMLTFKRPHDSQTEIDFINKYIVPLGVGQDECGNLWYRADGDTLPIMWSCHTDTVHRTEGKQTVTYGDGVATTDSGECLGADCTTGVWLMTEMIKAKVPGLYVFHRSEEIGGIGSHWIAQHHEKYVSDRVSMAIAFDRKGYHDVISHQGTRTASDAFCNAIGAALKAANPALDYAACDGGTFTDTASYKAFLPECTNLSVGYFKQHTAAEYQDVHHALALLDAVCAVDWTQFSPSRNPATDNDYPERKGYYAGGYGLGWGSYSRYYGSNSVKGGASVAGDTTRPREVESLADELARAECWRDGFSYSAPAKLDRFVYDHSSVVADFLFECGYTLDDLEAYQAGKHFGPTI